MCNSQDHVLTLECQVLAAHQLYLESLARAERIECDAQGEKQRFVASDLLIAERELSRNRRALRELLDRLGYFPKGMGADRDDIRGRH